MSEAKERMQAKLMKHLNERDPGSLPAWLLETDFL